MLGNNEDEAGAVTAPIAVDRGVPAGAGSLIEARGIGYHTPWGRVYGPTDVDIAAGGVTVIRGIGGRGRASLMLTLAGRMRVSDGTLTAFGRTNDQNHLFSKAALALVDEVDGLAQAITVKDVISERLRWDAPWYRWVKAATEEDLEHLCRPVFGPYSLPTLGAYVNELPELTAAMLRIALANVACPPLFVVGGVDQLTRVRSSELLLERLVALGERQTVVTADVNGAPAYAGVREVVEVENLTDGEFSRLDTEGH